MLGGPRGGHNQHARTFVVAAAFSNDGTMEQTNPHVDTSKLDEQFEHAYTRISRVYSVVVQAWDADILVLILAHYHQMHCTRL